ncbi:hypothetical protein Q0812_10355 [Brevundimonas sp. 2R-24]|uniref:Uncharacterized protein n=1 Tax=Peiella sedimenti TaxID=3061083 RepID=A0ABT8SMN2_9CAUL|nr:hypothetical protein [Caulobacteraceae bacterium XZ-24]
MDRLIDLGLFPGAGGVAGGGSMCARYAVSRLGSDALHAAHRFLELYDVGFETGSKGV